MWGRYLESGEYSDFLVTCANREFHVHRLVICPRSSYFRLMCKDNFKEGITQKLELVDEDPDVFQSVLTFLYTGIYETCKITGSEEIGNSTSRMFEYMFLTRSREYTLDRTKLQLVRRFRERRRKSTSRRPPRNNRRHPRTRPAIREWRQIRHQGLERSILKNVPKPTQSHISRKVGRP